MKERLIAFGKRMINGRFRVTIVWDSGRVYCADLAPIEAAARIHREMRRGR